MPHFAKRHYEAIAYALQDAKAYAGNNAAQRLVVDHIIERLARDFERDNGMFDYGRFIRACQPGNNVRARG